MAIETLNQALEMIVPIIKNCVGMRATRLKTYGYYSFSVKNVYYRDRLLSAFDKHEHFTLVEVNSYREYKIIVKNTDFVFSLNYSSTKQGSKLILDLILE
jgi:hypothetical protein